MSTSSRNSSRKTAKKLINEEDDGIEVHDDEFSVGPPAEYEDEPLPPSSQTSQPTRKRKAPVDDGTTDEESDESSSEEEEESASSSEDDPPSPPKKKGRGNGGGGLTGLKKIQQIAKRIKKQRAQQMKRNLHAAIDEIAPLLEQNEDVIAIRMEEADPNFVSFDDGETRVRVCVVNEQLRKIIASCSKVRQRRCSIATNTQQDAEWLTNLSEEIYETCEMTVDFDDDDWLVVVFEAGSD